MARHHNRGSQTRAKRAALAAVCLALGACAGAKPAPTVQLQAFLGAGDEGAWAYAEISESPGAERSARRVVVGADGKEAESAPLAPEPAQAAVAAAVQAREARERTVEKSLGALTVEGFDRERAVWLEAAEGPTRWVLEPVQGAPCELSLVVGDEELRVALRLAGGEEQLVLYRLPRVGAAQITGVLVLPRARRGLARTLSVSTEGGRLYRLEGLAELELGAGLSALLDARAVRALQAGALEPARADLERAVQAAPRDPIAWYNLACARALLGEEDAAILALGRAIDLEPTRLSAEALRDPDLDAIRHRVEFKLMIEPRREDFGD